MFEGIAEYPREKVPMSANLHVNPEHVGDLPEQTGTSLILRCLSLRRQIDVRDANGAWVKDVAVNFEILTVDLGNLKHQGELVTRGNFLRPAVDDHLVTPRVVDDVVGDDHVAQRWVVGLLPDLQGNGIKRAAGGTARAPVLVTEPIVADDVPDNHSASVDIWTLGRLIAACFEGGVGRSPGR